MIRLYLPEDFCVGVKIVLSAEHIHYLYDVMRLKRGKHIEVFNGRQGKWIAECLEKQACALCLVACATPQPESLPPVHLYISLFKRLDWVLEKSTELGVTHIHPIITQHSSVKHINSVRGEKILREASEQSQRCTVPTLLPVSSLSQALATSPGGWVAHLELWDSKNAHTSPDSAIHLWVGPEGGWSFSELKAFQKHPGVRAVKVSSFCLRTETAVVASLAVLSAIT